MTTARCLQYKFLPAIFNTVKVILFKPILEEAAKTYMFL